ncbi:phosphonate C-P lyase system protein PhnL [Pseudothauera rhizosphaerae]|uniref:Phosphonate C-P lyase system protein PhnL n=1 Tax=Pseudothauera rhizosphaerae TaxID=2565932 RepID=A0A4S4AJQ8_9RHOO|nr:phosphonate C-P lyase system protein PhnL [Pseudothauera rhizosphaerae]THF59248.1 phosphonate C-P lyase system protein PhnL [Pseudothauera rhizosphaerae]
MTRRPVLRVRRLSKTFTLHLRGGLQLPVLRDVSLDVHAGECVALVGPSGQGKSTLMKCLHGSYGADSGEIVLRRADGSEIDLAAAAPQQVLQLRRREMAYVSQFLRVVPRVPALDVVAERVLDASGADGEGEAREAARDRARALLSRLNLPGGLWQLPPATFSGGEQQRVNIARGFVQPATLLLLDEPTASLDAANRRVVIELIAEAKARGAAVVGIFHDEEVRDAVATRCVSMVGGTAKEGLQ